MSGRPATLGVGLMGCGAIASYAHLRILGHVPGARLVAAADPDPDARARARAIAGVEVHVRAEELLGREDVDAVVICAPTPFHAELAIAAVGAGKHVYLEKPIATTAEDARRVVAAARPGLAAAVGFNRRLHPLYEQARGMLRAGRIGPVRGVMTAFCEPTSPDAMPAWKRARASGGGVLLDLASHHFDSLRWFLGDEIAEVDASLRSERSEHDTARVHLATRGGVEAHGFFSYRAGHADFLEFLGETGTLRVDRYRSRLELRLQRHVGYGVRRRAVPPSRAVAAWRLQRPFQRVREVSFVRSLEAFVALAQGRPSELASLEDGLRSLDAVLAAEAAAGAERELPAVATA